MDKETHFFLERLLEIIKYYNPDLMQSQESIPNTSKHMMPPEYINLLIRIRTLQSAGKETTFSAQDKEVINKLFIEMKKNIESSAFKSSLSLERELTINSEFRQDFKDTLKKMQSILKAGKEKKITIPQEFVQIWEEFAKTGKLSKDDLETVNGLLKSIPTDINSSQVIIDDISTEDDSDEGVDVITSTKTFDFKEKEHWKYPCTYVDGYGNMQKNCQGELILVSQKQKSEIIFISNDGFDIVIPWTNYIDVTDVSEKTGFLYRFNHILCPPKIPLTYAMALF